MRTNLLILLGCAMLALPASASEKRVFTSADGSKTFEAVLRDYDAGTDVVTVCKKTGTRELSFKLSVLSEADQAYVREEGPAIAASKAIRIDFEVWKDKAETVRTEDERTVTTPAGYEIELRNWTKRDVENVEVRYTIFHRKDAENGPGSIGQTSGSLFISTVFADSHEMNRTDPINLVRYVRQGSGAC